MRNPRGPLIDPAASLPTGQILFAHRIEVPTGQMARLPAGSSAYLLRQPPGRRFPRAEINFFRLDCAKYEKKTFADGPGTKRFSLSRRRRCRQIFCALKRGERNQVVGRKKKLCAKPARRFLFIFVFCFLYFLSFVASLSGWGATLNTAPMNFFFYSSSSFFLSSLSHVPSCCRRRHPKCHE